MCLIGYIECVVMALECVVNFMPFYIIVFSVHLMYTFALKCNLIHMLHYILMIPDRFLCGVTNCSAVQLLH